MLIAPIAVLMAAFLGYRFKKIDLKGALTGTLLALIIWVGSGPIGLVSLFLFFVLGSAVSILGKSAKKELGLFQENDGKRSVSNVIANGGAAGMLSILIFIFPGFQDSLILMIVASVASACSDTLSSELGNIYGKNYYNILKLKPSQRGPDGVISIRGLWFGLFGSFCIAAGTFPFDPDVKKALIVTLSGFLGNLFDSLLGATLQRKGYINNHQVNFLATSFGSLIGLLLLLIS